MAKQYHSLEMMKTKLPAFQTSLINATQYYNISYQEFYIYREESIYYLYHSHDLHARFYHTTLPFFIRRISIDLTILKHHVLQSATRPLLLFLPGRLIFGNGTHAAMDTIPWTCHSNKAKSIGQQFQHILLLLKMKTIPLKNKSILYT